MILFNDDLFHFEARRIVEKDRNNLIDSRSDYRNEIALFLRLHFYDVNEIKKEIKLIEY